MNDSDKRERGAATWTLLLPWNGGWPFKSSNRIAPILHMSTCAQQRFSFFFFAFERLEVQISHVGTNWPCEHKCHSYRHTLSSYFWNSITSGAMYKQEPQAVSAYSPGRRTLQVKEKGQLNLHLDPICFKSLIVLYSTPEFPYYCVLLLLWSKRISEIYECTLQGQNQIS